MALVWGSTHFSKLSSLGTRSAVKLFDECFNSYSCIVPCFMSFVTMTESSELNDISRASALYGEAILIYLSFWISLYLLVSLMPASLFARRSIVVTKMDELDIKNRVVAACHGTFICFYCGYEFFFPLHIMALVGDNPATLCISNACGQPNNSFENMVLCISLGYFIYDSLAMVYEGLLDWAMTLHHAAGVLGMLSVLSSNNSAYLLICGMFIGEVSNPFMHVRMILKRLKLRYTVAYEASELAFMTFYLIGRLGVATPIFYYIVMCESMHTVLKLSMGVLWLQSIYVIWYSILPTFAARYEGYRKRQAAGVVMGGGCVDRDARLVPIWRAIGYHLFTPLTELELEKLGIDPEAEEQQVI